MNTKSRFEELLAQARMQKPRRAKSSNVEEKMQAECVKWLIIRYHNKIIFHHSPNEAKRSEVMGARLKAMGMRPGWPDLEILLPGGNVVFFEFKTKTGKQSMSQKETQLILEAIGHKYFIIRSAEDFIRVVEPIIAAAYGIKEK